MENFNNMSVVDWVYSNTWTEFPFLRQQQLQKLKRGIKSLVDTIPAEQCAELAYETMYKPADEYPNVDILQCFKDLRQEITDIDNYMRGD